MLTPWKKSYDQPRQHTKKQRHFFANTSIQSKLCFFSNYVWMWELDYKESWGPRNWCFWAVVLGKTLESPLDCKEIQLVHPKGNQSWIYIGTTDAEAETPILWPPNAKNWLIWKDSDAGKDWGQEEKGMTEDEMVGWHHPLDGHEFEQALGVRDGQGGLACCSPFGCRESNTTEWLNCTNPSSAFLSSPNLLISCPEAPGHDLVSLDASEIIVYICRILAYSSLEVRKLWLYLFL